MNNELNVYIGCGEDIKEGFLHMDVRKLEHIDFVCESWNVSNNLANISHIYSSHSLEYLTNFEADRSLRDWLKALKTDGTIEIVLTNMDYIAKLWLEAEWNEENLSNKNSNSQISFSDMWGKQENSDPWDKSYTKDYVSVRKSGYNKKRIEFLLARIGYVEISIKEENELLLCKASKPLGGGERQDAKSLEDVRLDHINRYEFASTFITKEDAIVTDGACGVAYGSYILAQNSNVKEVNSIDISKEAISHGKQFFSNKKIKYHLSNLEDSDIPSLSPDYYISFETIEHLPNPEKYIEKISQHIKDDCLFIGSTPNETIMPYTKYFSYHTQHFTQDELEIILRKHGFTHIKFYQQKRKEAQLVENAKDGQYIIFVAKKTSF